MSALTPHIKALRAQAAAWRAIAANPLFRAEQRDAAQLHAAATQEAADQLEAEDKLALSGLLRPGETIITDRKESPDP